MGRVEHDGIDFRLHQRLHTGHGLAGDADTRSYQQTSVGILRGIGLVLRLRDVVVSDQPQQVLMLVNHRQLLNLVLLQQIDHLLHIGVTGGGDQVLGGHHLGDGASHLGLKTEVAVGDDAHEAVLFIDDGDTADLELMHHALRLAHRLIGAMVTGLLIMPFWARFTMETW